MTRGIGRRSLFFLALALVSAALAPASPAEFRWVPWFAAILALFWAIVLGIEEVATPRGEVAPRPSIYEATPFAPPPRPGEHL